MDQMDKNTVPAENQVKKSEIVSFINETGHGKRILLVGNSMTCHGPKADIGWDGSWGMAASCAEKDYVHILAESLRQKTEDPVFCICKAAGWERHYQNGIELLNTYEKARDFCADVIVIRIIENCPKELDREVFCTQLEALIDYFNKTGSAQIIVTSGFWKHPGDELLALVAREKGADFVCLGDLGEQADMRADGLFWHTGVAAHPGDKGMAAIAARIEHAIRL